MSKITPEVTSFSAEQKRGYETNTYQQNADFWVQIIRDNHDRFRTGLTDAAVLNAIGNVTGKRVLDAGCGEGYLSRELASLGATVLGVDSSQNLIEAASASVPKDRHELSFQVSDVADLREEDASFDIVVCNHLMNDLPEPSGPIFEFSRVLEPGGLIVILMLHPCFYAERTIRNETTYQGPGISYFHRRKVTQRFNVDGITSPEAVTSWHRPLEFYVQALRDADLWITNLQEPHPSDEQLRDDPWWQANFRRPLFLLITAQKHGAIVEASAQSSST